MVRWVILTLPLAFACGGSGGSGVGSAGSADAGSRDAGLNGLVSISLSQTDVRIPVGTSTAFAVSGTYADGSRADVTPQAEARSSNPSVATVQKGPGSQIQIFAMAAGTATVAVEVGNLERNCAVTVTPR
ncbi:MAG: Ig-like domain-containing protein [Myxococcales bacterium]